MANFFDLIGRIMISAIFLFSGINKILNYDGTKIWNAGGIINYFLGTFQTHKKGKSFKN